MGDVAERIDQPAARTEAQPDRTYRLLQGALVTLRAGPALILLLLIVVVSLTTPIFFTSRNLGNVLSQTAVIAVLALGQLLVIVSRGIDLSVGSTVALSGVVGAIVYQHEHSAAVVILAILGTGLAVGLCNGIVLVLGRVPHPFIVTLASLSIVRGLALWAASGTLIAGMPGTVQTLGGGSIDWLPYSFFITLSSSHFRTTFRASGRISCPMSNSR
jgi:ribose transport system permease protein